MTKFDWGKKLHHSISGGMGVSAYLLDNFFLFEKTKKN
jgi:hypothetical protein